MNVVEEIMVFKLTGNECNLFVRCCDSGLFYSSSPFIRGLLRLSYLLDSLLIQKSNNSGNLS